MNTGDITLEARGRTVLERSRTIVRDALRFIGAERRLRAVELSAYRDASVVVTFDVEYRTEIRAAQHAGEQRPPTGELRSSEDEAIEYLRDREKTVFRDSATRTLFRDRLRQWASSGCRVAKHPDGWGPTHDVAFWYACSRCRGHGRVVCPRCDGAGTVEENCSWCFGSGTRTTTSHGADGKMETRTTMCWSCGGSGSDTVRCGTCSGRGTVACSTCAATGALTTILSLHVRAGYHDIITADQEDVERWLRQDGPETSLLECFQRAEPTITPGSASDQIEITCGIGYGTVKLRCGGASEELQLYGNSPVIVGASTTLAGRLEDLAHDVRHSLERGGTAKLGRQTRIPIVSEAMARGYADTMGGDMGPIVASPLFDAAAVHELMSTIRQATASESGRSMRVPTIAASIICTLGSLGYAAIAVLDVPHVVRNIGQFQYTGVIAFVASFMLCWSILFLARRRLLVRGRELLREETAEHFERTGRASSRLMKRAFLAWLPSAIVIVAAIYYQNLA